VPQIQTLGVKKDLEHYREKHGDRAAAMILAYLSSHYTLEEIGTCFGKGA
jgi:hypothetical protein